MIFYEYFIKYSHETLLEMLLKSNEMTILYLYLLKASQYGEKALQNQSEYLDKYKTPTSPAPNVKKQVKISIPFGNPGKISLNDTKTNPMIKRYVACG